MNWICGIKTTAGKLRFPRTRRAISSKRGGSGGAKSNTSRIVGCGR
jgi:hypothetical protein